MWVSGCCKGPLMVSPLGFFFWEVGYDSGREGRCRKHTCLTLFPDAHSKCQHERKVSFRRAEEWKLSCGRWTGLGWDHLYNFGHRNTKGQEIWPINLLTLPRAEVLDSMEAGGSNPLMELVFCMFSFVLSFPICKMWACVFSCCCINNSTLIKFHL